jgi:hypothetical protein
MAKLIIVYPWNSDRFMKAWDLWKEFKKEQFRFPYKPIGEQGALKNLGELSNGSEETAILIIHQSINNGWRGLFKLKTDERTNNQSGELTRKIIEGILKDEHDKSS